MIFLIIHLQKKHSFGVYSYESGKTVVLWKESGVAVKFQSTPYFPPMAVQLSWAIKATQSLRKKKGRLWVYTAFNRL